MENQTPPFPNVADDIKKFWLAIVFIILSLAGIIFLSVTLLHKAPTEKAYDAAQMIFSAILPLLGTWIGAILAYYFGTKQIESNQVQQGKALDVIQKQAAENRAIVQSAQEMMGAQMRHIESLSKQ